MFEERIQKGIAFLDQQRPGWEHEISLEELSLIHGQKCILGQLYGSCLTAFEMFHLEEPEQEELGFYLRFKENKSSTLHEAREEDRRYFVSRYSILTEEWKEAIRGKIISTTNISSLI